MVQSGICFEFDQNAKRRIVENNFTQKVPIIPNNRDFCFPISSFTEVSTFEEEIIPLKPDSKGENIAVLIKLKAPQPTHKAVMYIHGYTDYFFQEHLARWYVEQGFDFYALELRKYGRSILPHQRPNHIRRVMEYYEEIDETILRIKIRDRHQFLLINGHSTGGLVACMYANFGKYRNKVNALFLNSPFLEFNIPDWQLRLIPRVAKIGHVFPEWIAPLGGKGVYAQSLHKDHWGRWEFSKKFKPLEGFRMYFGWFRAMHEAQSFLQKKSKIECPILIFHSDKTSFKKDFDPEIFESDVVLNVNHIKKYGPKLGTNVTIIEIPRATHDVFLSKDEIVKHAFSLLRKWLVAVSES
jgi:alpha-beta hydrolase superfamily lysophospholipase